MSRVPYQSGLVKLWNFMSKIKSDKKENALISSEEIFRKVEKKSKNNDWKNGGHVEALSVLLSSISETGNLHSFGKFYVKAFFTELLTHRERLNELWLQNPEILNGKVCKPIIILGLPRSGTSFVFNLLAKDPCHRFLSNWETTVSQVPSEKTFAYLQDPRRRKGRYLMQFQDYLAPQLKEIHEFHLDGPEECTPLLMQGFATQALAGMFNVPEYSAWLDTADYDENYSYHKQLLQTLQWKYPGQRWLLKSPDHLAAIDSIIKAYPDACFVHLHRDPVQSVASWASLNAVFRGIYMHSVDPTVLGEQVLDRLAKDMELYLKQRQHHESERFVDIYYQDLIADPLKSVRTVYEHFDLDFSANVDQKMRAFLDQERKKTRSHRYTLESVGLSSEMVEEKFKNYIDTFNVPLSR